MSGRQGTLFPPYLPISWLATRYNLRIREVVPNRTFGLVACSPRFASKGRGAEK
jgi:hypothetical protein